jgi:hypothetical protein
MTRQLNFPLTTSTSTGTTIEEWDCVHALNISHTDSMPLSTFNPHTNVSISFPQFARILTWKPHSQSSKVRELMLRAFLSARCFLTSHAISSNEGRFDGTRSQLAWMTFMSLSLTKLEGGIEGLMFSSVQSPRKGGCSHHYRDKAERYGRGHPLKTECRTALSSMNGHGRAPIVRISPQQMANA